MASERAIQDADRRIAANLRAARRLLSLEDEAGRAAARRLRDLLERADKDLAARLATVGKALGGGPGAFTDASVIAYRTQIDIVRQYVEHRIEGVTNEQAARAVRESMAASIRQVHELEEVFTGVTRSLRLDHVEAMDNAAKGVESTLLRRHATSVDRYGQAMIGEFESEMRDGLAKGYTQREMVARLTGHGGPKGMVSLRAVVLPDGSVKRTAEEFIPEGLFQRKRYWAERIVRTEVAEASNRANLAAIEETRRELPDMKKKILATFDNRTALDSIVVHGQVRELEGLFRDGAGREYLRPPARPNDRETVIPWREAWAETDTSRPKPPATVEQAVQEALDRRTRQGKTDAKAQGRAARRDAQEEKRRRMSAQQQARLSAREQRARDREDRRVQRERQRAAREETRRQQELRRAFKAGPHKHVEIAPPSWTGEQKVDFHRQWLGRVKRGADGSWVAEHVVDDLETRSGYRTYSVPGFKSARAAAEHMAFLRWSAEEQVIAARARPALRGHELRRARLRDLNIPDTPGEHRNLGHAMKWAEASANAVPVNERGEVARLSLGDWNAINRQLAAMPPAALEGTVIARGGRLRILRNGMGAAEDPTWGGGETTFDGRSWTKVDGAHDGRTHTTRANVDRTVRESRQAAELEAEWETTPEAARARWFKGGRPRASANVLVHELGHALDFGAGAEADMGQLSDSAEFHQVMALRGNRARKALDRWRGAYVAGTDRNTIRESWAEGFALSRAPMGRRFLEQEAPELLDYFDRVAAVVERDGGRPRVPPAHRVGGSVVAADGKWPASMARGVPIESWLEDAEVAQVRDLHRERLRDYANEAAAALGTRVEITPPLR